MYIIENEMIGLVQYTHDDDADMFLCWQDLDTQKGYNGIFNLSFEEFCNLQIERFKFWTTIKDKRTSQRVGSLRLGLDDNCPDLAIWIYPQYRNKRYGIQSFSLALKYIFATYPYQEISAGCYENNTISIKMLREIGFHRYPNGDTVEVDCFSGKSITQLEFRITREQQLM